MVATSAQHWRMPLKATDKPIHIVYMWKWGQISFVTLCLMGLMGFKCRDSTSIITPTGKHFAYEHPDTLLSQVYPDPCTFSLFFIVSVNHSVASHNLFLQHAEGYNRELMLGRSHLK